MDYKFAATSFVVMLAVIIGLSILVIVSQWLRDRCSPKIVTQAMVLDKRIQIQYVKSKKAAGM